MKTALFVLLGVILVSPAMTAAQYGDFTYSTAGSAITITKYTGAGGAVIIPDTIDGLPVTSLGGYSFAFCPSLTNITIPGSISSIGNYAFNYCTNLLSVTIPGSISSLGYDVFANCTSLGVVTIENGVTSIWQSAFASCTSLTNVTIPDSVTLIQSYAFDRCTSLASISIPMNVTNLGYGFGWGAFNLCSGLKTINVDKANAFYSSEDGILLDKSRSMLLQCPASKGGNIIIPSSVKNLGERAFYSCSNLANVNIPSGVTNVGPNAFTYCTSLIRVTIPGGVAQLGLFGGLGKNAYVFAGCTSLASVAIGDGVTGIGDGAFSSCTSLTNVTVPSSVTRLGASAFASCTALKGVFCKGNSPIVDSAVFNADNGAIVYYLFGTTGWGATLGGRPTVLWNPMLHATGLGIGVQPAGFVLNIAGTANLPFVLEGCTNLIEGNWQLLQNGVLTNGSINFCDPIMAPSCFYRIRSPL